MSSDALNLITMIFAGMEGLASCCGFPILILSLVFLIYQTRLGADQNRAAASQSRSAAAETMVSVYNAINSEMMEIDRYFVEHPDLKSYFYGDKKITPRSKDFERVASMAEWIMDFMDNVLVLSTVMKDYPWKDTWVVYFKDLLTTSQPFRYFWSQRKEWYSATMLKYYPRDLWEILEMAAAAPDESRPGASASTGQGS